MLHEESLIMKKLCFLYVCSISVDDVNSGLRKEVKERQRGKGRKKKRKKE